MFVSAEQQSVSVNERVSVSCNVSGHPQPELHWLNKHNGQTLVIMCEHLHTHMCSFELYDLTNNTSVSFMLLTALPFVPPSVRTLPLVVSVLLMVPW